MPYVNRNPTGFDAASVCATFAEPCPTCAETLQEMRGSWNWTQHTRIEAACPECGWEGVFTASPAKELGLAYTTKPGAKQMALFTTENTTQGETHDN